MSQQPPPLAATALAAAGNGDEHDRSVVQSQPFLVPGPPNMVPLSNADHEQAAKAFKVGLEKWKANVNSQVFVGGSLTTKKLEDMASGEPTMHSLQGIMVELGKSLVQVTSEIGKLTEQTKNGNETLGTMMQNLSMRADSSDAKIQSIQRNITTLEDSRTLDSQSLSALEKRVTALEVKEKNW